MKTPSLQNREVRQNLPCRRPPYWNILEYCRHLGFQKLSEHRAFWTARVRRKDGGYKQHRLAPDRCFCAGGIGYDQALTLAMAWFESPSVQELSSASYPVGSTQDLRYQKTVERFTIGDALVDFVEWKRIAATRPTFETLVSLINFHLVPRLADIPLEDFNGNMVTQFCRDILETPPKRGNQPLGGKVEIAELGADALRRRKGTLNTLLGILRSAIQMAWENGNTNSERAWRCVRRVPNQAVPRQIFLSREQCRTLIDKCRPELADLVRGALYTGCRISELSELRVRDVGRDVFGIYIGSPKNRRPRYVHLPTEGMRFFLKLCDGAKDEDRLFRTRAGQTWNGGHRHLFKQAVEDAGLPKQFVFHGLRHTYASQLVQAGVPLIFVAKQLGHANTDTVSRTYGHLCAFNIDRAIQNGFAPLEEQSKSFDHKISVIRQSLQSQPNLPPAVSWPRSNFGTGGGEVVELLRGR